MVSLVDEQISARLHAALEPITQPLGPALTADSIARRPSSVARPRVTAQRRHPKAFVAAALMIAVGAVLAVHQQLATAPAVSTAITRVAYTTAMVQQMAAATRAAVADSGTAHVSFTDTLAGQEDTANQIASGSSTFTFSGSDLNLASQFTIAPAHQDGAAAYNSDTLRVVAGREYGLYRGVWYLLPGDAFGPSSTTGLLRPDTDPRLFLQTLSPMASFRVVDRETVDGVALTHLRAANEDLAIPFQIHASLEQAEPNGKDIVTPIIQNWVMRVPALNVWVDDSGVVHRMDLTASVSTNSVTTIPVSPSANVDEATTQVLTLTFSHLGEGGIITAPAHVSTTLPSCGYACIDNFYPSVPPIPQLPPSS